MTRRSIREVHETRDSFLCKRLMEVAIFFDLFLISLNFQFWTLFLYDSALQDQASKLTWFFSICLLPIMTCKLCCRFWPWAKPKLQAERVFALLDFQFFCCLMFVLLNRVNCKSWTDKVENNIDLQLFCVKMLPDLDEESVYHTNFY